MEAMSGMENPPKLQVCVVQQGLPKCVFPGSGIQFQPPHKTFCVWNNHKADIKGTI